MTLIGGPPTSNKPVQLISEPIGGTNYDGNLGVYGFRVGASNLIGTENVRDVVRASAGDGSLFASGSGVVSLERAPSGQRIEGGTAIGNPLAAIGVTGLRRRRAKAMVKPVGKTLRVRCQVSWPTSVPTK